jgi:hypothetical protein
MSLTGEWLQSTEQHDAKTLQMKFGVSHIQQSHCPGISSIRHTLIDATQRCHRSNQGLVSEVGVLGGKKRKSWCAVGITHP